MPLKLKGKMQYYQSIHIPEMTNLVLKVPKLLIKNNFSNKTKQFDL